MRGVTRTFAMMFFGFPSPSGPFEGPASVKPQASLEVFTEQALDTF
jgi:hypothetical protein